MLVADNCPPRLLDICLKIEKYFPEKYKSGNYKKGTKRDLSFFLSETHMRYSGPTIVIVSVRILVVSY